MAKKKINPVLIIVTSVVLLAGVGLIAYSRLQSDQGNQTNTKPTSIPLPVNQIDVSKRPYVTLEPLPGRNELELTIHNLPVAADTVEVTLEYDRNKGVLDAVLKQFSLATIPLTEEIFLGSKSAGGHTTYHDDVIGGFMTLKFNGQEPYTLKVPWRYADTEKSYKELSTADGFFQAVLTDPITQPKIIVMQSPGAPDGLNSKVIAGPYLIRTVGVLPQTDAMVTIRMPEDNPEATLYAYDGEEWQKLSATLTGKTVTYTGPLNSVYVVTE